MTLATKNGKRKSQFELTMVTLKSEIRCYSRRHIETVQASPDSMRDAPTQARDTPQEGSLAIIGTRGNVSGGGGVSSRSAKASSSSLGMEQRAHVSMGKPSPARVALATVWRVLATVMERSL